MPIVGAASSQRRSFFYLELPLTTLFSLSHNSLVFSLKNSLMNTHTRTHIPRKRNGFARDTPLVNHNGYMVSLFSPLGLTSLLSMQHVYIHQVLDSRTHYQPP